MIVLSLYLSFTVSFLSFIPSVACVVFNVSSLIDFVLISFSQWQKMQFSESVN